MSAEKDKEVMDTQLEEIEKGIDRTTTRITVTVNEEKHIRRTVSYIPARYPHHERSMASTQHPC